MATFTTRPIQDVLPNSRKKGTGERAKIKAEYTAALKSAIDDGEALLVEHEEGDKALTIKNRIYAAAKALGLETEIVIKKLNNKPITTAYHRRDEATVLSSGVMAEAEDSEDSEDTEEVEEVEVVSPMPTVPAQSSERKKRATAKK